MERPPPLCGPACPDSQPAGLGPAAFAPGPEPAVLLPPPATVVGQDGAVDVAALRASLDALAEQVRAAFIRHIGEITA